jgi:hypothetical protein
MTFKRTAGPSGEPGPTPVIGRSWASTPIPTPGAGDRRGE